MGLRAAVLFVAAFVMAGGALAQDEHVAIFKNISGVVKVVRNDAQVEASNGMALLKQDRVISAPGASGGIVFKDGTLLTLGASTEISIRDYLFEPKDSKYAFSVYM